MGLDLYLFKVESGGDPREGGIVDELCYGRKTWALANYFALRATPVDEYYFKISKNLWNEFIDLIHPYASCRPFYKMVTGPDLITDDEYAAIERFLDNTLHHDDPYQLGVIWEARVVMDWYDSDGKVQSAFIDGYDIWMCMSY